MKRTVLIDPFFDKQPQQRFIDELRTPEIVAPPADFGRSPRRDGEIDISGLYIAELFPDEKHLLDTVLSDFNQFMSAYRLSGSAFPVRLLYEQTDCFEGWRMTVSNGGIHIYSADTEGIRRALIGIEDEIRRRCAPFLPAGETTHRPTMRVRMTRCFFSPINRPPKYGDELSDDIDYYPEAYLNRLMHDGANAVWIYTRFSDLVESSFLPDYGKGAEGRIEKLNRVCEKCARYGIKPYVFAIEPVALTPEQSALLPQVNGGQSWDGRRLFCTNTPEGRAFLEEIGEKLFTRCPDLGGFMSITYGERPTSCTSAYSALPAIGHHSPMLCPRCKSLTPGEALSNACRALAAGIHKANPNADVISWTYGHRLWPEEDIRDYARRAPSDVVLMQNFEEIAHDEQLGVPRLGVDYWLSQAGPSDMFRATAEEARAHGKTMFMKTQVCCSHEVATVPYIPVPGLLFDRYKAAHELGVTGVMQCWYFGNYPSLMSKAAGELSFMTDFSDKRGFLVRLAALYWGEDQAPIVADAWTAFEQAYKSYPLNIMFSYYGPMHDGPVWELSLKPRNFSLPRTWQTLDPTDGDRIGECLLCGHTLGEAIELCRRMSEGWQHGLEILRRLDASSPAAREQLSVAEALSVLFDSGLNILRFYELRDHLGYGEGSDKDYSELLAQMRALVLSECENSRRMIALCEGDGRLGYHSEGEGYKYFPEKLTVRISALERLLSEEFPEVEERLKRGLTPLEYYDGIEPGSRAYVLHYGSIDEAEWESIAENAAFRAAWDEGHLQLEFRTPPGENVFIDPEFHLMFPSAPAILTPRGETILQTDAYLYYSLFGARIDALKSIWKAEVQPDGCLRVCLDRSAIDWTKDRPFKMRIQIGETSWLNDEAPVRTLGKGRVSPGDYGWFMPSRT